MSSSSSILESLISHLKLQGVQEISLTLKFNSSKASEASEASEAFSSSNISTAVESVKNFKPEPPVPFEMTSGDF